MTVRVTGLIPVLIAMLSGDRATFEAALVRDEEPANTERTEAATEAAD